MLLGVACSDDGGGNDVTVTATATDPMTPTDGMTTEPTTPQASTPTEQPTTTPAGPCANPVQITLGAFERQVIATDFATAYRAEVDSPAIGLSASDELEIEFTEVPELSYNGAATGAFDLSMETERSACSRCLVLRADGGLSEWFQTSGTITVNADPITGSLDATLTDVVLAPTFGVALQNDTCYGIATATLTASP